jgi:hypothetical protein
MFHYLANFASTNGSFWPEPTTLETLDLQMVVSRSYTSQAAIGDSSNKKILVLGGEGPEAQTSSEIFSFEDKSFSPGPGTTLFN